MRTPLPTHEPGPEAKPVAAVSAAAHGSHGKELGQKSQDQDDATSDGGGDTAAAAGAAVKRPRVENPN